MKKIFALVLALAMVLSMGAAFANTDCVTIDWSSVTNCGTGKIDLVPYVATNGAYGNVVWTENDCAAALNSQYVYYAIRITVDENPNQTWWDAAQFKFTYGAGINDDVFDGMSLAPGDNNGVGDYQILGEWDDTWSAEGGLHDLLDEADGSTDDDVTAGTYYLAWRDGAASTAWTTYSFTTSFDPARNLFANQVANVSLNTEICAYLRARGTLTWDNTGDAIAWATNTTETVYINGYDVMLFEGTTTVYNDVNGKDTSWGIRLMNSSNGIVDLLFAADNSFVGAGVWIGSDSVVLHDHSYGYENNVERFTGEWVGGGNTGIVTIDANCAQNNMFNLLKSALAAINREWGVGVSRSTARDRLGWKAEYKDCFAWNANATAIVDTNCVIEIPKTGDVSVVAYAVMALVTAAGALKFRK